MAESQKKSDGLKQKTVKAFIWDFIGKGAGQFVHFVTSIILARILLPEDFGLLAMITIIITVSRTLVDSGLGLSLIQRQDVTEKHYSSVFFFNIVIGLCLATILFCVSGLIADFYRQPMLVNITKAMSLIFIISSFGNVQRVKLRKTLNYRAITQSSLLSAIGSGTIGISLALCGFGVWSLVIQGLTQPLFSNILLYLQLRWSPKLQFDWQSLKQLWSFGFRMFISKFLDSLFINLDSVVIGKLFSPAILGYFFRAKSLTNIVVQYSSGSLANVLFPAFSQIQHDKERMKRVVFKTYHFLCMVVFFLTGLMYITGEDIVITLFTEKWLPSVPIFKILILCCYVGPLSGLLMNILSSQGNSKDYLRLEIIKKVFSVANLLVGFQFGFYGYLYGYAIISAFILFFNIFYASKEIHVSIWFFWQKIFPYMVICIVCVVVLIILQHFITMNHYAHFFVFSIIFTLLYWGGVKLLNLPGGIFLQEEIEKYQIGLRIKKILKIR